MSRDPWANRDEGMQCKTCMYFVRKGSSDVGRCRRHAPTMKGYPVVFVNDWCGDHKLSEKAYEKKMSPKIDLECFRDKCTNASMLNVCPHPDIPECQKPNPD